MSKKKKKCDCWYGASPSVEKHNDITVRSVCFVRENKAAIFYFDFCPKCGRKL